MLHGIEYEFFILVQKKEKHTQTSIRHGKAYINWPKLVRYWFCRCECISFNWLRVNHIVKSPTENLNATNGVTSLCLNNK